MFLSATAHPLPALARTALMTQSADALENKSIGPLTSYQTAFARRLDCGTPAGAHKDIVGLRQFLPHEFFQVCNLVAEKIQFARQALDFGLGTAVHVKVEFAAQAVLRILAILAHHDHRSLNGREH